MKTLEHRRHTMRVQPGQHLSQAGVDLARKVGQGMGPFAHVVTSPLVRAYETAIAMGFAPNDLRDELKTMPDVVEAIVPYPSPIADWAEAMRGNSAVQAYAHMLASFVHSLLDEIDDGQSLLLVSHGGIVEATSIACALDHDWANYGDALSYCEGTRLKFTGSRCTHVELLRISN